MTPGDQPFWLACVTLVGAMLGVLLGAHVLVVVGRRLVVEPAVRRGDWVCIGGRAAGVVERLGSRGVALCTADRRSVVVPRRALSTLEREVATPSERCRLHATLSLLTAGDAAAAAAARAAIEQILCEHAATAPGDLVARFPRDESGLALTIELTAWLAAGDYRRYRVWRRGVVSAITRYADRARIRCLLG